MREPLPKDNYGIAEIANQCAVAFMDNNTRWLDIRKEYTPEQRRMHWDGGEVCASDAAFDKFIRYFHLNAYLTGSIDSMVTTPMLSMEFSQRTAAKLEEELWATLPVPGRRCAFKYAAHKLGVALGKNVLYFDEEQEKRAMEIKNMLYETLRLTRVSEVNFDLLVRSLVSAESIGSTVVYTNDRELNRLLPKVVELRDSGGIRPAYTLEFHTTRGKHRKQFRKAWPLEPLEEKEVA